MKKIFEDNNKTAEKQQRLIMSATAIKILDKAKTQLKCKCPVTIKSIEDTGNEFKVIFDCLSCNKQTVVAVAK